MVHFLRMQSIRGIHSSRQIYIILIKECTRALTYSLAQNGCSGRFVPWEGGRGVQGSNSNLQRAHGGTEDAEGSAPEKLPGGCILARGSPAGGGERFLGCGVHCHHGPTGIVAVVLQVKPYGGWFRLRSSAPRASHLILL